MSIARSRRARVLIAFGAVVAGWVVGGAAAFGFDALTVGGASALPDMLFFVALIGLFAVGAWAVSVLPLALFGDHASWFFRPLTAPIVGAACGGVLLLLENWIFFDFPPWELANDGLDFSEAYLLTLAGLVGAVTWTTYTLSTRRWVRRDPEPSTPEDA